MRAEPPLGPVVLDISDVELQAEEAEILQHPQVGGVIFFRRNFESPEQLVELIAQIRALRPGLVLAVDQEGGRVQRFKAGLSRLPPLQAIGNLFSRSPERGLAVAEQAGWLMAAEMLACGLDISFAPVLDADDSFSAVIGDRSFSADTAVVEQLARAYIGGMNQAGMRATLKHFPGHGAVEEDSHHQLPVDGRSFDEVWQSDMTPFRQLLPSAGAVMPAHIVFSAVDPSPVGFSSFWLQKVLRQQLQFSGVIFSDDLSMEGAAGIGDHGDRAEAALAAGCDVVLVCNQPKRAIEVIERLNAKAYPTNDRLSLMKSSAGFSTSLEALRRQPRWRAAADAVAALL
jgi:beta-N-acetylhexosaminidase